MISTRSVTTPWGFVEVNGRLGQQHADLVDVLFHDAVARKVEGSIVTVAVDPARVRARLRINREQLDRLLDDLRHTEVRAEVPARGIISKIEEGLVARTVASSLTPPPARRKNTFAGHRELLRVDFGLVWSSFLTRDLQTLYSSALLSLRFGISQAMARFCLSHVSVNDSIAGLFQKVGASRQASKLISELLVDAETLEQMGVLIDFDRCTVRKTQETGNGVSRRNPEAKPQKPGKNQILAAETWKKPSPSVELSYLNSGKTGALPSAPLFFEAPFGRPASRKGKR